MLTKIYAIKFFIINISKQKNDTGGIHEIKTFLRKYFLIKKIKKNTI